MSINDQRDIDKELADALARAKAGVDLAMIELPDIVVFPRLIPAMPATARKARSTGILLGRPGPLFVKRGHHVRYRLSDVYAWLESSESYSSTAEASMRSATSIAS
ncbi:hypothetical protein HZS80_20900 [Halomonas glaciei]|uniref:DNA-binding protein n=1 Tax=Vreelandella glaciei TaxID=186761 RepID=A0A7Z0LWX9_9GAMM|nr:hypothetical protein [Halomonas glaciei]NYS80127.1 hypothetical protein [Halomonas glaciei]